MGHPFGPTDPQWAPLIAPKKSSGRHAARLRGDGITARLSCSFNFLTIRGPGARVIAFDGKALKKSEHHEAFLRALDAEEPTPDLVSLMRVHAEVNASK